MANDDLSKLKINKGGEISAHHTKRKAVAYVVVAIFLITLLGTLYTKGFFTPSVSVEAVTVARIYPSQTFTMLNASGYVVAQRKAAVASKTTGRLVWLGVEEGSKVKKGQVVARLENDDVVASKDQAAANLSVARSGLDQAKAELNDAATSLEREKVLLSEGFTTRARYDTAEARYKRAKAAVEGAEFTIKAAAAALQGADVSLEYAMIRAPFDGVVLTKNADIGDIITPLGAAANAKAAVVTIADMSSLHVEVDVSESNLSQVKPGQPCEIQLDALPDSRFRGAVHMIVPTADRTKATVMVKVRFLDRDSRILPEMSAKVAFLNRPVTPDEQKPRTALNAQTLIDRVGKKSVFLIKEDRVVETPVKLGVQLGDMVEIIEGVKAGDRVVAKPSAKMKSGDKIKVDGK